ncbi:MAG TPA: HTH domain-containing protein, partial [Candidatus Kapabacteria bacterium]|nr:HTH domain-containing protein [Candidatus Kapabacteria bacterium]
IPRILKKYDPSIFLFTENFFRITFMYGEEISQLEEDSGLVDGLVDGLVETQRRLLQILKVHPFSSKQELAEQLKISTTAIDKNIKALKGKGLLRRIGHDKGGHWEVVLNEENFAQKSKDPHQ